MKRLLLPAYALVVAWFSLSPVERLPVTIWDKLGHFLVYGLFVALAVLVTSDRDHLLRLTLIIVAYGVCLEFVQFFVPGRTLSVLDMFANAIGAFSVMLVANRVRRSRALPGQ